MRKTVLCASVCLLTMYTPSLVTANKPAGGLYEPATKADAYMAQVYARIDFGENDTLPFDVFQKACRGYLNLKNAGKLSADRQILSICDFTRSSGDARLWIIDMAQGKVLYHTYVAHGQGSGEEFATAFSNRSNSHQSSLGFYVTGDTYEGEHGLSLRLHGMDNGFNSAAYDRGIVVHGAAYVCNSFIREHSRLGRSWGCPAVAAELSAEIIGTIKDGTCLFVYYPDKRYLASAYWLNRKIERLPEDNPFPTLPVAGTPQPAAVQVISLDSFQKQGKYLFRALKPNMKTLIP